MQVSLEILRMEFRLVCRSTLVIEHMTGTDFGGI